MKLLLDETFSRRLAKRLSDLFPESIHVALLGLLQADDEVVWEYALSNEFCIVTSDSDFFELATSQDSSPKLIWLRDCDYPSAVAEELIRSQAIRIVEFLEDPERTVLILRPESFVPVG